MAILTGKKQQEQHDYALCDDPDCPRFPCRIYKEAYQRGWLDGYSAGRSSGLAEGYAAGFAAGAASAAGGN